MNPTALHLALIGDYDPQVTAHMQAIELLDHPFFVATLFQPERAALTGASVPLVSAWLQACLERSA